MVATERLRGGNEPSLSGRAGLSREEKPVGTWCKVRCIHFLPVSVMKTYCECLSCAAECKAVRETNTWSLLKVEQPTTHTVGRLTEILMRHHEAPCLSRSLGDVQT